MPALLTAHEADERFVQLVHERIGGLEVPQVTAAHVGRRERRGSKCVESQLRFSGRRNAAAAAGGQAAQGREHSLCTCEVTEMP